MNFYSCVTKERIIACATLKRPRDIRENLARSEGLILLLRLFRLLLEFLYSSAKARCLTLKVIEPLLDGRSLILSVLERPLHFRSYSGLSLIAPQASTQQ